MNEKTRRKCALICNFVKKSINLQKSELWNAYVTAVIDCGIIGTYQKGPIRAILSECEWGVIFL